MRRLVSLAAIAVLGVGLIASSATADSAPATQTSYRGLPSGWHAETDSCRTGRALASPSLAHVVGPATPPNGKGSLKVGESNSDTLIGVDAPGANPPLLSTLTAFNAGVYSPRSGGLIPSLTLAVTVGTTHYLLVAPSMATGSWVNLNAATATLGWVIIDTNGPESAGAGTLHDFVSEYSQAVLDGFIVSPANECGSGSFYVDGLHYTVGAHNAKVDFESPLATVLTNVSRPRTTRAGHLASVSVRLKQGVRRLAGQSVKLWVRPSGTKTFRLLRTVKTNGTGLAVARVAPMRTSSYQWRYQGVRSYATSKAAVFTIATR